MNRQLQSVMGVASSSPNPRTRAVGPWGSPGGPGVGVDTTTFTGYKIPPFYDSMVGKLIVHGADRHEALMCERRALEKYRLEGIKTTVPLHLRLIENESSSPVSTTSATSRGS